jgi:uncharacterized protein YndB with AHSA1/START domain
MTKIELEYQLKTSPVLLYSRLSTASGLVEWFADNVIVEGKKYTFIWDKTEHQAEMVASRVNEFIRFKWVGNESSNEFEMRIVLDDITGDLALMIVDEVDDDDHDDIVNLWDAAVARLKMATGS